MTDHKLLPRVPTEEMLAGADKFYSERVFTAVSAAEIYQAMFDAAPAAELPGWEEMVEKAADYVTGHSYDGKPDLLGDHGAIAILTAARVPELLARVQRLETALRRAEATFTAIRANTELATIWALAMAESEDIRAALENKP